MDKLALEPPASSNAAALVRSLWVSEFGAWLANLRLSVRFDVCHYCYIGKTFTHSIFNLFGDGMSFEHRHIGGDYKMVIDLAIWA